MHLTRCLGYYSLILLQAIKLEVAVEGNLEDSDIENKLLVNVAAETKK